MDSLVIGHITGPDAASLIPSMIALVLTGVGIGVMVAPRFVKRFRRNGDES
jgi:hypothetical protein